MTAASRAGSCAALVLAGGAARRMGGGDKPLLMLGDRPILVHALDRLRPVHDMIAISANGDPARYAAFGFTVLGDATADEGPLGGILAGLRWAAARGADTLLTVPGDTPFLPRDLASRLGAAPAMAASGGRRHPPVSIWPVAARDALADHLEAMRAGPRRGFSVVAFARAIGMRVVDFETVPVDPFLDIDTQDDLDRAARILAMGGPC